MESTGQKANSLHPAAYAFRWQFAQEHPGEQNLVGCEVLIKRDSSLDDAFAKPNNRWQGHACFGRVERYSAMGGLCFEVSFKKELVAWFAPSELVFVSEPRLTFELDRVKPEAYALAVRPAQVTWGEWQALRVNSYERKLIHRHLDDDALARLIAHYIEQAGGALSPRGVATTYVEQLARELAPLVLERWQAQRQTASSPLTQEQLAKACANVGVDLTCGACAATFYTGAAPGVPHDCKERADD